MMSLEKKEAENPRRNSFTELGKYEPYDHGNTDHSLPRYGALFHLVKYIIGTGILVIPFAFKNVGYVVGIIGTLTVGMLYSHIIHLLLESEYELCKRLKKPNLTYIGLVEHVFKTGPKRFRFLGPYFHCVTYFDYVVIHTISDAGYLLVMGGSLKGLYDGYYGTDSDVKDFLLGLIVPLIVLCWIPRLRFLVPLSLLTNFLTLFNVIIILIIPIPEGSQIGEPKAVNDIFYFPQFFAMILAAQTATGLVLPIKNDMEKPKYFGSSIGVLNISMFIVTIAYATFGLLCYLKYGDTIQGDILLNLPKGHTLSILVYCMYTLTVCVSYTLCFYIVFDTIWSNYLNDKLPSDRYSCIIKYGLKTFINILVFLIAIAIPNFELYSSLVGTLGILIDLCIPPALHIIVLLGSINNERVVFRIFKDVTIIIISLSLFVGGLSGTVIDIIEYYNK